MEKSLTRVSRISVYINQNFIDLNLIKLAKHSLTAA